MSRRSLVAALVFGLVVAACSSGSGAGPSAASSAGATHAVSVTGAWARPAPAGGSTAVYLTLANGGSSPDALVSASSPTGSVELHETSTDMNGMTGMSPVERIELPAGATVALDPGGKHLMVTGLTTGLDAGGSIDVELVFEHAGPVHVAAEVRTP